MLNFVIIKMLLLCEVKRQRESINKGGLHNKKRWPCATLESFYENGPPPDLIAGVVGLFLIGDAKGFVKSQGGQAGV